MAGGDGLRLGLDKPKQFCKFFVGSEKTLLQETFERAKSLGSCPIYVSTQGKFADLVLEQLPGLHRDFLITEPVKKNTAASLAWSMEVIGSIQGRTAPVICMPSDHLIVDSSRNYEITMAEACAEAKSHNCLVTIGIAPSFPSIQYGYIEIKNKCVLNFHEKPSEEQATKYIEKGYIWNSGIFVWCPWTFLGELVRNDNRFDIPIIEKLEYFSTVPSVSVDYAVLEKSQSVHCIKGFFKWSDVGTTESIEGMINDVDFRKEILECLI